jgi:hypothetical protein
MHCFENMSHNHTVGQKNSLHFKDGNLYTLALKMATAGTPLTYFVARL